MHQCFCMEEEIMFCWKCGTENPDGAVFCKKCGVTFEKEPKTNESSYKRLDGFGQYPGSGEKEIISQTPNNGVGEDALVDPKEKLIFRLGKKWVVNMASLLGMETVSAMVTDKRIYLQGRLYESDGKMLIKHQSDKIVNIEDVNATGLNYSSHIGFMIAAIIFSILTGLAIPIIEGYGGLGLILLFIGIVFALVFWLLYAFNREIMCHIEYGGGSVKFRVVIASLPQVKLFCKEIHRVTDFLRKGREL